MANLLLRDKNDLDFGALVPGDLLLVANPTDAWQVRYTLFWSHVGIVTSLGVIDAIRDPRGDYIELQRWGMVQCAPFKVYTANHDILALRVKSSPEVRRAAVDYAQAKIGLPYSPNLRKILFNRRDTEHYSCGSLAWQAYMEQGIDLAPSPFEALVLPAMLIRSPYIESVAYGTRYAPIKRSWRHLGRLLERLWFRYLSRAKIIV
jgi:uncharacterized protein YycO